MRKLMTVLLVCLAALLTAGTSASASSGDSGTGWVRLAHLGPDTPVVDVYLYAFGDPHAYKVIHGVGLGVISPYMALPAGEYTIAIREVGAKASVSPAVSTAIWVQNGMMYTVVGIGDSNRTRLAVLDDTFQASPDRALVRVLSASLSQRPITVSAGSTRIAKNLSFNHVTPYRAVPPGPLHVVISGLTKRAVETLILPADSAHTLIVLDGSSGPRIIDLTDAVGVPSVPSGGAPTGLGGTAPHPAPSPVPWLVMIGAGTCLALTGVRRFAYASR